MYVMELLVYMHTSYFWACYSFHHSLTPLLLCGESWGDRILFLHAGKILASGTSAEIKERFSGKDLDEVFVKIARNEIEALHL